MEGMESYSNADDMLKKHTQRIICGLLQTCFDIMTDRPAILSMLETPTIQGRIINVTHMLPYEIAKPAKGDFELTPRRGHGAMYSGIESLSKDWQCVHIGGTGPIHYDEEQSFNLDEALRPALKEQLNQLPRAMVPVFLDDENATNHYEGYCKTGQYGLSLLIFIFDVVIFFCLSCYIFIFFISCQDKLIIILLFWLIFHSAVALVPLYHVERCNRW
jgi:hypothetical protein